MATEAATIETKAQQSELSRVRSEIQREAIQLTSLSHQRMNADKNLVETLEKARQQGQSTEEDRRSWKETVTEHSKRLDRDNVRLNEMKHGLEDRERLLADRERRFEETCAETERMRVLAEQKLNDDRLTYEKDSKKVQDDVEKAQRKWLMLCDYGDQKDGQVFNISVKADNLQALVTQLEAERKNLQAMVRDRDSNLQEQGKKLTKANDSLESTS